MKTRSVPAAPVPVLAFLRGDPNDVLTADALASAMRVCVRTICRMASRGDLPPPARVGRKHAWRRGALQRYYDRPQLPQSD